MGRDHSIECEKCGASFGGFNGPEAWEAEQEEIDLPLAHQHGRQGGGVSNFQLKKTSSEYVLEDASGYSFHVTATLDPEFGWSAHVAFASHGMQTEDAAIDNLTTAVARFLRMAEYAPDVASGHALPGAGGGGEST